MNLKLNMKSFCFILFISGASFAQNSPYLWYNKPSKDWNEALPLGNGRLGAMVFGGIENERIQLNEETVWGGTPGNNLNPNSLPNLSEIRKLVFEEKHKEAYDLATKNLLGTPSRFYSYQTLGDLMIETPLKGLVTGYRRDLNIETGQANVSYTIDGVTFTREIIVSERFDCIVIKISANKPGQINGKYSLTRSQDSKTSVWGKDGLVMNGQIMNKPDKEKGPGGLGMKFSAAMKILPTQGSISVSEDCIMVERADEIYILISAATDYNFENLNLNRDIDAQEIAKNLVNKAYPYTEDLISWHMNDFKKAMGQMTLKLGKDDNLGKLPTNERLAAIKNGVKDSDLFALYFMYGRYLLVSSSRSPGKLPANLQGIWNEHYDAPWNSDFHTNINLQMNYWPANITNLDNTNHALFNFIDNYRVPGREAAKKMYGANGWTIHHATDLFGKTGVDAGIHWGMSPLAGAWLATHLWEHYLYTEDSVFLREKAYPIIKETTEFIESFLVKSPNGSLSINPSISPENSFLTKEGRAEITHNPSIDIQVTREIYSAAIRSSEILNIDKNWSKKLQNTLKKLPEIQISKKYGIIQEWVNDYEEAEPGHRHISQLIGLYPFAQITSRTPEFFKAADATLTRRLSHGGGHTGWSRAWITALYARLQNKEKAYENIHALLAKSTLNNLFDTHPPFQIDGNFGGTAAIAEMLLQSHTDIIEVLPVLPNEWGEGSIFGIKARGNIEFEIIWRKGKLTYLRAKAARDKTVKVKYHGKVIQVDLKRAEWRDLKEIIEN